MSQINEPRRGRRAEGKRVAQTPRQDSGERRMPRRQTRKRSMGATIALRFFQTLGTLLIIGVVTGAFLLCYAVVYIQTSIMPNTYLDLSAYTLNENSVIYYTDKDTGLYKELTTLVGDTNSEWVDIEDIPEDLIDAVVAIEDKRFWTHNGVDWRRTAGAVLNMFFGMRDTFGGSTITQQLVKNVTDNDDVTVKRKVQEIFTALELEKNYKKEEILEMYLNVIYLGSNCYGVQSASQKYFGKDVSELSLAECASLAGITNNPSLYSPNASVEVIRYQCSNCEHWTNTQTNACPSCGEVGTLGEGVIWTAKDYNKARQETILSEMLDADGSNGVSYITQAEYDAAVAEELPFINNNSDEDGDGVVDSSNIYSWYVEAVISEVRDDLMELTDMNSRSVMKMIYSGGLSIYCNLDPDAQAAVEAAYEDPSLLGNKVSSDGLPIKSAITVVDNRTGAVVAIAGDMGQKTANRIFNYATAPFQPGSSFKPLAVYAPALEMGLITPATVLDDNPVELNGSAWPKNDQNNYLGLMTVRQGVAQSRNTIALRTLRRVGVEASYQFLTDRFGFTTLEYGRTTESGNWVTDVAEAPLSMGGLTDGVSTLEMAAAYAAFPRGGVYTEPSTYTQVVDRNGEVLIDNAPEDQKVLKPSTAYYMNEMLTYAVQSGTGTPAKISGMTVACKTGTTNDNYARWFAGYTPYYTAAVWVGYEYNREITGYRTNPAVTMWKTVMTTLHEGLEDQDFPSDGIETERVSICLDCGNLAVSGMCDADSRGNRTQTFTFVKGDAPVESCTCHVPVEVCTECPILDSEGNATGGYHLAGEFCPAESRKTVYVVNYDRELAPGIGAGNIGDYSAMKAYYDTLPVCTVHDGIEPSPDPSESGGIDWPPDWWPFPGESDSPEVSQDPNESQEPVDTPSVQPTPPEPTPSTAANSSDSP